MASFVRSLVVSLPLVFCWQAEAKSFAFAKSQILYLGNGAEPKELDPTLATGTPEAHILDNLFEGLTSLDMKTLEPTPGMAESWTVSPDGKVYTFKIRKNARWSDNKEWETIGT